jgi:hypothetical protein
MILQRPGMAGQRVETIVIVDRGVTTVTRSDVVWDLPEKFGIAAHAIGLPL